MSNLSRKEFLTHSALGLAGTALGAKGLSVDTQSTNPALASNSKFANGKLRSDEEVLEAARQNIDTYRKGDVAVRLVGQDGKPLTNFPVDVKLQQHHFKFGDNNVAMDQMYRVGDARAERLENYRDLYANLFNALNCTCYWTERPRNNLAKTADQQGELDLDGFIDSVEWALAHNIAPKGHNLFWTVPKAVPDWLEKYPYETQMNYVEVRIRDLTSRFKDQVLEWDLLNEILWEPAMKNFDKREWPYLESYENIVDMICTIIQWAREENPDAAYLLNDYGTNPNAFVGRGLTSQDGRKVTNELQRKRYIEIVQRLSGQGCQPNAIGLQCHIDMPITLQQTVDYFDEMSAAGVPLQVTEYFVGEDDLQESGLEKYMSDDPDEAMARYTEDFMTVAFGHPAIKDFYFWGVMGDAVKWEGELSPAYNLRPVYHTIDKLINDRWTTEESLVTNGDGYLRFHGFYGDYSVRYRVPANKDMEIGNRFSVVPGQSMPLEIKTVVSQ
ncbi:endo-1,4-beta-xylanase [Halalkalibaculum sp. DA3122]|uniref:endo-1,4-beta-xylanase n=1 Tax=Halalkalibaculum sp. DA3122 TaxID=3373607 RepID=UPI00375461A2